MTKKKPLKSIERFIRKNIWGFTAEALAMANRVARLDPVEIERMVSQNPGVAKFVDRQVFAGVLGVNLMEGGLKITNTTTGDSISLTEEDLI
jgi:hypothetical protein